MKRYSKEEHQFLQDLLQKYPFKKVQTEYLNKYNKEISLSRLKSYKNNHHIRRTIDETMLTDSMKLFIRENAKGISNDELTRRLNNHFGSKIRNEKIQNWRYRNNVLNGYSNIALFTERGKATRYRKGIPPTKPIQKGQRISPQTEFKKGEKPLNTLPIGTEIKKGDGYIWVKVREEGLPGRPWRLWEQKHRLLWQSFHGEIPLGYKLIFKDGNIDNCTIENLMLVSNSEHAVMNMLHLSRSSETTETSILIAKLQIATRKRKKMKDRSSNNARK